MNGVNYVSPVRDQRDCGSCYSFAFVAAMESRIRIMTQNKVKPILSVQDAVSCSNYSQGCKGGFPFLVGKYGEDYEIVDEECFPYAAKEVPCSQKCKNPKYNFKLSNTYKLGIK